MVRVLKDEDGNVIFEGSAELEEIPKANIIITGKTGVGKSTLINQIFGEALSKVGTGRPVTQDVTQYTKPNIPVSIYDTIGLELDKERQEQTKSDMSRIISDKFNNPDPVDLVHAIWYCVNAGSSRFEDFEADFIRYFRSKFEIPFFVILTQCTSRKKAAELKGHIVKERRLDVEVILTLAEDYETDAGNITKFGLDEVVDATVKRIPEFVENSFISAQRVDMKLKHEAAMGVIKKYVKATGFGKLVRRIPLVNIGAAFDDAVAMFKAIGDIYGLDTNSRQVFTIVSEVFSKDTVWSILKCTPVIGEFIGDEVNGTGVGSLIKEAGTMYCQAVEEVFRENSQKELENVQYVVKKLKEHLRRIVDERITASQG
ncbi:GTPase [Synergistales bacterium]|nr:GTPase [Synergistales bacterium]